MNSESFGEYIRRLRKDQNISLRVLSAALNIDQSTLSKIERNIKVAPQYIVSSLADFFNEDLRTVQKKYLSDKLYHELKDLDYAIEAIDIVKRRLNIERKGTRINNTRQILIDHIQQYLANKPVKKAWLFGSFARNEAAYDSDIDLMIELNKKAKIDLLDYIGYSYDLEKLLKRNVDLVQQGTLKPDIEMIVDQEKILIYEQ